MKKFLPLGLIGLIWLIWPKQVLAASFSLSPASSIVNVNDLFSVDIILDTAADSVSGATAILRYDTTKLQVQDGDSATAGVQISQGTVFNQTPLTNTVDAVTGTIRFDSGSLGTSYVGRGVMATVNFRAVAAGTAQVSFVFSTTTTTDTSLVAAASGPTNLLTTVQDGNYTVNTASQAASTPPTVLYSSGTTENTLLLLAGGLILIGGGFLCFKKLA